MQEQAAVTAPDHAAVEDQYDTTVGFLPDQATETLPETDHGLGHRVFHERVSATVGNCLCARLEDRFGRYPERQSGDNNLLQGATRHIDAFPEGVRGKQDTGGILAEFLQQAVTGRFALFQDLETACCEGGSQLSVDAAQHAVGSEKHKAPAICGQQSFLCQIADGFGKARFAWFWDICGHRQQGLLSEIEG